MLYSPRIKKSELANLYYSKCQKEKLRIVTTTLPSLIEYSKNNVFPLSLVAAAVVVSFFLPQNDHITFLTIAVLLPIFIYYKYDCRILIGCAILLLVAGGVLSSIKEENNAEQIAIVSYWLLVVGTSCLLIECFRKKSRSFY
jgi:cell division protein FtsW (lipid II flippase)